MTGAGAATVAFTKADGFLSEPTSPTYYRPGRNLTVDDFSIDRQLTRLREEGDAAPVDSIAGNLSGSLSLSWVTSADTHSDIQDIVFNGAGGHEPGRSALSRWYLGTQYLTDGGSDAVEVEARGCTPTSYSISYEQGGVIRESLSLDVADFVTNGTVTPSGVVGPSDGSDAAFHAASLSISGASVSKLQSFELSWDNISRLQYDDSGPIATDAVVAAPEPTLSATAIYAGEGDLERIYGSSGATAVEKTVENVSGSLSVDVDGINAGSYELPKLKPADYSWDSLVDGDTDLTDPVTYHVNGGVGVS
jgi:hypothetical protein